MNSPKITEIYVNGYSIGADSTINFNTSYGNSAVMSVSLDSRSRERNPEITWNISKNGESHFEETSDLVNTKEKKCCLAPFLSRKIQSSPLIL